MYREIGILKNIQLNLKEGRKGGKENKREKKPNCINIILDRND